MGFQWQLFVESVERSRVRRGPIFWQVVDRSLVLGPDRAVDSTIRTFRREPDTLPVAVWKRTQKEPSRV